jgi:hypothetical protein
MRAKFYINKIVTHRAGDESIWGETLYMTPVCPSTFGANGEHEDNDFHRYTPSGSLEITISNPNLYGKFKEGEKYYLDFTLADLPAEIPPASETEQAESARGTVDKETETVDETAKPKRRRK